MGSDESIGVVTCCWQGDEQLVKATCASIRHFCPKVPLCIIVDGSLDIDSWAGIYQARTLYVRNLKCEELRKAMLNSMFAKHAALFEGPFDRFIYLDSDALFWGDPFKLADLKKHDFTIFGGTGIVNPVMIEKWQFALDLMRQFDPSFHLLDHPYFSAGVYGARRNCLPKDRFLTLAKMARSDSLFFKFGDQGVLNYLVFSEFERKNLSYQTADLQFFPGHFPKKEMNTRFVGARFKPPPKNPSENLILHFSGKKPVPWWGGQNHKATFTCFRLLHGKFAGRSRWTGLMILCLEDLKLLASKIWSKVRRNFFGL
jgi:hypothetical protein